MSLTLILVYTSFAVLPASSFFFDYHESTPAVPSAIGPPAGAPSAIAPPSPSDAPNSVFISTENALKGWDTWGDSGTMNMIQFDPEPRVWCERCRVAGSHTGRILNALLSLQAAKADCVIRTDCVVIMHAPPDILYYLHAPGPTLELGGVEPNRCLWEECPYPSSHNFSTLRNYTYVMQSSTDNSSGPELSLDLDPATTSRTMVQLHPWIAYLVNHNPRANNVSSAPPQSYNR